MKVHHYSKALSWITRPRVTETATLETFTPELDRMDFNPGGRVGMKPGGLVEPGVTHYGDKENTYYHRHKERINIERRAKTLEARKAKGLGSPTRIWDAENPKLVERAMNKITEVMDNPEKFPELKNLKAHLGYKVTKGTASGGDNEAIRTMLDMWKEKTKRTIPENRWGKLYKLDGTETGKAIIDSYIDSLDAPRPKGMQELADEFGLK